MSTETELYKTCTGVYCGTRQLSVKEQRGRKYVNFKGRQINIKDIPEQQHDDPVFDHIFNFGWRDNPNPELDRMTIERIHGKPKPEAYKTITIKLKSGEIQQHTLPKETDIRSWIEEHNISFAWFRN